MLMLPVEAKVNMCNTLKQYARADPVVSYKLIWQIQINTLFCLSFFRKEFLSRSVFWYDTVHIQM